ncbi:MAG: response regulator transcription factor [Spirochaetales bacterium]|nr:MAG: response regulator transcription factor [Spirochaetales bacterium]
MKAEILIIEDEEGMVLTLKDRLEAEGYTVVPKKDGRSGEEEAKSGRYDLIVLDLMLPVRDGFQVCSNLREAGIRTPILMLTARTTILDTVTGLRAGADDYLRKPFDMQELLARVHALLRRSQKGAARGNAADGPAAAAVYRFGDFTLDTRRQELSGGGKPVPLNTQEYSLMVYLASHPHRVLSRDELLDEVWGYGSVTTTRTVDVHVAWLRQKLGEQEIPRHLVTVRGRGYRFEP